MKKLLIGTVLLSLSSSTLALTLPFELKIQGNNIDITKQLELSDVDEGKTNINFDFKDSKGKQYNFDLKYKALPKNRSYPSNLDVTIKDGNGKKLGYLFFANNGVSALKKIGTFGLMIDREGKPMDIKFVFDNKKTGDLAIENLGKERFVQDTLVPKFGFQMIRPVILPTTAPGVRSQSYQLDNHPYSINYTLKEKGKGLVEFQHNLYHYQNKKEKLLERIYFEADSLETLREAMYAGKYFHETDGEFKLVFYPAMGQTQPE